MRTVGALFRSPSQADQMRLHLQAAGIPHHAVRVIDHPAGVGRCLEEQHDRRGKMWKAILGGAFLGGLMFAIGGVLAGFGSFTVGIGGAGLAIGTFITFILLGMFTGVFLGVWVGYSECECDTHLYVEGVRRGGAVVIVKAAGAQAIQALDILQQANAVGAKICGPAVSSH